MWMSQWLRFRRSKKWDRIFLTRRKINTCSLQIMATSYPNYGLANSQNSALQEFIEKMESSILKILKMGNSANGVLRLHGHMETNKNRKESLETNAEGTLSSW